MFLAGRREKKRMRRRGLEAGVLYAVLNLHFRREMSLLLTCRLDSVVMVTVET